MQDLKYYLYVSETKVNMLFDQIEPSIRDKITGELKLGINWGVVAEATVKIGEPRDKTLIHKLRVVLDFLRTSGPIGTVDRPQQYFCGSLPMRWGRYGDGEDLTVFFFGRNGHTIVGLGGSFTHVTGHEWAVQGTGRSHLFILQAVLRHLAEEPQLDGLGADLLIGSHGWHRSTKSTLELLYDHEPLADGEPQHVEFVAMRLLEGTLHEEEAPNHVVLGSPLYVALVH